MTLESIACIVMAFVAGQYYDQPGAWPVVVVCVGCAIATLLAWEEEETE